MEEKSKVYALADSLGRILRIEGGYTTGNIADPENWVLIDEGTGDRYNLCQSNYLPGPIMDDRGICRYKLVDGKPVERSQWEMDLDKERARINAQDDSNLIPDEFGNKYEQIIVNGKMTLKLVESADGTLNI